MGLRETFSPCILENFIAEYYDRITSNAIARFYSEAMCSGIKNEL